MKRLLNSFNFWYYFTVLVLSFVCSSYLLHAGVLWWGDGGMYMFGENFQMSWYLWNESVWLWEPISHSWAHLILNLLRILFLNHIWYYQVVFYFLLFSCAFIGVRLSIKYFYKISGKDINDKDLFVIALVMGLLYIFNPISVWYRLITTNSNSYFFFLLPLLLWMIYRFLYQKTIKSWIQFIFIFTLLSFVTWLVPQMLGVILFLIVNIVFWYFFQSFRFPLKMGLFTWGTILLMNIFWILPLLLLWSSNLQRWISAINPLGNIDYLASIIKLHHILLLYITDHWWILDLAGWYFRISIISTLWFAFVILILLLFIFTNTNKNVKAHLLLLFLLFVDWCNPNGVFAGIIKNLINNAPILALYRTAFDKLSYFLVFIFILIVTSVLISYKRYYLRILILLVVIMNAIPFLSFNIFLNQTTKNYISIFNLPDWYYSDFIKLSALGYTKRILVLPLFSQDRMITDFWYNWVDSYIPFLQIPFLWNFTNNSTFTRDLLWNIYAWNIDQFNEKINMMGIEYIIIRKDYKNTPKYLDLIALNPQNKDPLDQFNIIKTNNTIIYVWNVAWFEVYKNTGFQHGIFKLKSDILLKKINTVQYSLGVEKIITEVKFEFFESFHPGWKLYLEPYSPLDCTPIATYTGSTIDSDPTNTLSQMGTGTMSSATLLQTQEAEPLVLSAMKLKTLGAASFLAEIQKLFPTKTESPALKEPSYHTTECKPQNTFYAGGELSKLWEKPVFDDTHKLVYDYANQWTIDPVYIRANYPKEYYKQNPDGTIDVRMTLYFRPQSYFYLGLIISGTTFMLLVGYLGWSVVRKSPLPPLTKGGQ